MSQPNWFNLSEDAYEWTTNGLMSPAEVAADREYERALDEETLERHGPASSGWSNAWRVCRNCGARCLGFPCAMCGSKT